MVISEIGIGDALTLLPAIDSLARAHPSLQISLLAPGLFPLRDNFDRIRLLDPDLTAGESPEIRQWLKQHAFDFIWNTENEQSPWRPVLAGEENRNWISAPAHKTWPRRFVLDLRQEQLKTIFPDISPYRQIRFRLTPDQLLKKEALKALKQNERWIAVQPGAKDQTKCWPVKKFEQLINALTEHPENKVKLFLTGPEKIRFSGHFLNERTGLEIITEPLDRLLPVLAACDLFVGNDSGFYHLAHALGLPVIGIYRSHHNMKVWSYPDPDSLAVCFRLPGFIRRYWHYFIPVRHILNQIRRRLA